MAARSDWAVILARGLSTRMGLAKGLCRLPGDTETFLQRITALYCRRGFAVACVTTDRTAAEYRKALPDLKLDRWILRTGGGGTAGSVMAALADLADRASHLWLHPVDLPSVRRETVATIADRSLADDGKVIVPRHENVPGHPVVMPTGPFVFLVGWPVPSGQMRPWLLELTEAGEKQVAPLVDLPVTDPGVVTDYDDEGSLTS
jgi:CTP:molybdopterin cytidylyltransferase MocA